MYENTFLTFSLLIKNGQLYGVKVLKIKLKKKLTR